MGGEEDDISYDEQRAFSDAHRVIWSLLEQGFSPVDVGKGVLVAAISILRENLSNEDVSKIFYEVADDYATRSFEE